MLKTLKRIKESLKYIGIWNILIISSLIVMQNVSPILYGYINKGLTDGLLEKKWTIVYLLIGFMIIFWLISTLLNAYEQNIRQRSMTKAENFTQIIIRKKLCSLPLKFFERPENLEILNKASRNDDVYYSTYRNIFSICIITPSIIVAVIPLVRTLLWTCYVLLVLIVINSLVTIKCSDIEYLQSVRQLESERKRAYYKSLFYNNDTIKEIKSYGIQQWLIDKYELTSKKIFKDVFRMHIRNGSIMATVDFGAMIIKIALWIVVALEAIDGKISVGDCVLFISLWDTAISLIAEIRYNILGIYTDLRCMRDVNSFLDFVYEETDTITVSNIESIELRNVSFAYPAKPERNVLNKINLTFHAGKCYLLLGKNGAGKSSLIKLLLKHYVPSQGKIIVNKNDELSNVKDLKVGYMAQEDVQFSLSVKENILFGGKYDRDKFFYAIEKSGVREIIEELPEKEDTLLGKAYNEGRELSGGQWQRISFARLLYNDSDIIILDEPTANLDPIAERNLYHEIQTIFRDKIVILISHRLSSVNFVDSIIFLENGYLKGVGSHLELLNLCGSYLDLYQTQKKIIGE